jgi:hypothetical protein
LSRELTKVDELRETVQVTDIDQLRLLAKNIAAAVGNPKITPARHLEKAGLCEVGTSPANAVVHDRLASTRKKLRTVGFGKAERIGEGFDRLTERMLFAVGGVLE